jgi:pentatricopeptide repeat protein
MDLSKFEDPFLDMRQYRIASQDGKKMTRNATNLVNILDQNMDDIEELQNKFLRNAAGSSSVLTNQSASAYLAKKSNIPKSSLTAVLKQATNEGTQIKSIDDVTKLFSTLNMEDISSMWDFIEFGRAPDPDYSKPINARLNENIKRANLVMADMRNQRLKPDSHTLTSYLSVFANATRVEDAEIIFESIRDFGFRPHVKAYRIMIQMYIRKRDMDKAKEWKLNMIGAGSQPDGETYGSYIPRNGIAVKTAGSNFSTLSKKYVFNIFFNIIY